MMPLLFSLGQHAALEEVSRSLVPGEHLFAFLDDICLVSKPGRVGRIHDLLAAALWRHSGIQIHHGKTQVWNRASIRPDVCDRLERVAQVVRPDAQVWRGSMLPTDHQGVRVLGTPLGHLHHVARHLQGIVQATPLWLSSWCDNWRDTLRPLRLPPWTVCWDGVHRLGEPLLMWSVQTCDSRRNSSLACHEEVGNTKQHLGWNNTTETLICFHG